jgi:hypothetical protein
VQSSPSSAASASTEPGGGQPAPASKVHVVFDPDDSPQCVRLVMRLACPAVGRAVCHPAPTASSSALFAIDLLVTLGKRFDAVRSEHAVRRGWQLTTIWMQAEQITDLFVLRADRLAARRWQELLDLAQRCCLRLWLINHRPALRPGHRRVLAAGSFQALELAQFTARWQPALDAEGTSDHTRSDGGFAEAEQASPAPFPEVPGDDFPLFRAACRRLLDEASFDQVDLLYQHCHAAASGWLGVHLRRTPRPSTEELRAAGNDEADLLRLLRGSPQPPPPVTEVCALLQQLTTTTSSSAAETLVRLRGIQAAFFARGFLLHMQLTSGAQIGPADLRLYLDQEVAKRLRALCTPLLAAAMTLALITEMTPAQLCELNLADVAADGATVQVDGDRFAIPAYARSLVRAQLLDRAGQDASDTDPLFVTPHDQQRSSPSAMLGLLGTVSRRAAVTLPERHEPWISTAPTAHWLRRRGLAITWIGYPYQWPPATGANAR